MHPVLALRVHNVLEERLGVVVDHGGGRLLLFGGFLLLLLCLLLLALLCLPLPLSALLGLRLRLRLVEWLVGILLTFLSRGIGLRWLLPLRLGRDSLLMELQ